ncbi:MAG: hypothetical protein NT149_02445, partial [Candidatus Gottesmanbacteria bacterium]|nr:hypothetical protein [Candidatus Gottesmanbacteria bacterium]
YFMKNKPLVVIIVILFGVYIVGSVLSNKQATTKNTSKPSVKQSACQPLRSGFKQPPMEALFLQETVKRGFEGIIRKTTNSGQTSYFATTNMLPESSGPYYLWIIDADRNGQICKATNIGLLLKNSFGAWTITFKQSDYSDDSMKIAITENNFGSLNSDQLTTLSNPNIILIGSYDQSKWVTEINLSPTPVTSDSPVVDVAHPLPLFTDTPQPTPMPKGLVLTDQKMTNNYYPETNPTFTSTLHNYAFVALTNVVVRFSFYKQQPNSCSDPADDNEYILVSPYIAGGDSQVIKTLVKTNIDRTVAYNWCANIWDYKIAQ